MATQLLIYQSAVPVTRDKHLNISVRTGRDFGFAREVNSVPLTAVEFSRATAEYPVVFAGEDDAIVPVVILGVRDNENLFVDEEGAWKGTYVPAFVRRYPFVFSSDAAAKQFILNIDEGFEGVNSDGRGERLFDSEGNQTQYLKGVLNFLQEYQAHFQRTRAYCRRLKELELLTPMQAQFNLADGERRSLAGFQVVDREKLKAVDAEALQTMLQTDELECTFLHLASLLHFNDMVGRMAVGVVSEEATAAPPAADGGGETPPQ